MLDKSDYQRWYNSEVTKEFVKTLNDLRDSVNINQADIGSVEKSGIMALTNHGYIQAINEVIYEIESIKDQE